MPRFTNTPPADARGPAFPIVRTPTTHPLLAIVTCTDLIGCATHFFHGRTVPCEDPDCPACQEQLPWRWHGYLSALNTQTKHHFIYEMTARAAQPFVTYRQIYNTLRGCLFEAHRLYPRHNSRIIVRCKTADLEQIKLPSPPNIENALSIIWNIPAPEVQLHQPPPPQEKQKNTNRRQSHHHPVHLMDDLPIDDLKPR